MLVRAAILAMALSCVQAFATNKTVKAGGGGDFTTIQACATAMAAGDTCTVYVGTYNENVTIPAGTAGNYKTITVNGSDVVTVKGFTMNSHTKLIGNCVKPAAAGSCGFTISTPSTPNAAPCVNWTGSITDFFIVNNVMNQCGSGFQIGSSFTILSTFGFIQGNTLSYACVNSGSAVNECNSIMPFGDHFLIENNDLSHYTLSIDFGTTRSVYRNNTFHDQFETEAGGNHHTDAFFSEPGAGVSYTVEYNVFEGNFQYHAVGPNSKTDLFQNDSGTTCPNCFNAIWRFNTVSQIGSGVASNYFWPHIMAYNNTIVDALTSGANNGTADYAEFSTNGSYINQLYYFTFASGVNWNVYQCGSGCNFGHNLYWCTGTCTSVWGNTPAVPFLSDPGNVHADPKFANYISAGNPSNDYHLQVGSPAIAAGTNLTTVASGCSGSTSSITATDASYFQDGFGITGVQADWLRVGAATTVQISAVNYSTNVITLANAISCSNGNALNLYKNSSGVVVLNSGNPDMGAFPASSGAPAVSLAPTALHFGNTTVGTSAPQQSVVLTNSGSATLNINFISCPFCFATFPITSNGCGSTLAPGSSCTVQGTFHPSILGFGTGNLTFSTDASTSPDVVIEDGTGVAPAPAVSLAYTGAPGTLAFGSVPINTTSAGQGIVLTNSGTATLNITSILPGGANPGQYTVLSNTCGSTLSASFSCTVTVAFAPTSVGSKPASIIFTTDASSSPDTVVLSGTGSTSSPAAVCAACFAQLKVPTIFTCKNVVSGVLGLNFNNCNCTCK